VQKAKTVKGLHFISAHYANIAYKIISNYLLSRGSHFSKPEKSDKHATTIYYLFDVNSANVLEDLQWSTLDVRRHRLKSVLMYKILNEQSAPSLREKFIKIKDLSREYNLRSNDTDLALPKPKTNYLKRSFKYSGVMLWNSFPSEAKKAFSLYQFKCSMPTIPETRM
jgi:hypothetical protein